MHKSVIAYIFFPPHPSILSGAPLYWHALSVSFNPSYLREE